MYKPIAKDTAAQYVLQKVQPALLGLMDGSVSTLAPLFAAVGLTHQTHKAFFVGLAAALGAGISMGLAEALSVYFAGIWTTWIDRENGNIPVNSFAIPTCEPDTNYNKIHTRMPVAFNEEQRRLWMHQEASYQQLMGLLQTYNSTFLKFKEVGRKRLPKKKDDYNSLF